VSAQGKHDGLYWPAGDGQDESPLQPSVAQTEDEGYPGQMRRQSLVPYQGYLFRILLSQGDAAPRRREAVCAARPNDWGIPIDRLASELRLVRHHELYCQSGRRCIPKGPRAADSTKRGKYNAVQFGSRLGTD
jgi:hypothetical protein